MCVCVFVFACVSLVSEQAPTAFRMEAEHGAPAPGKAVQCLYGKAGSSASMQQPF